MRKGKGFEPRLGKAHRRGKAVDVLIRIGPEKRTGWTDHDVRAHRQLHLYKENKADEVSVPSSAQVGGPSSPLSFNAPVSLI